MCISTIDIRNKSSLEWRLRWNRWEMFFFRERKTWKCNLPMNFSMYMKGWILHWLCYWTWNSRWTDYNSYIFAFTCFRAGHTFLGELMVTSKWSHDYTCVTFRSRHWISYMLTTFIYIPTVSLFTFYTSG